MKYQKILKNIVSKDCTLEASNTSIYSVFHSKATHFTILFISVKSPFEISLHILNGKCWKIFQNALERFHANPRLLVFNLMRKTQGFLYHFN